MDTRNRFFYIILFLCVCIVGFTSVLVTKKSVERLKTSHMEDLFEFGEEDDEFFSEQLEDEDSVITVEEVDENEALQEDTKESGPSNSKGGATAKTEKMESSDAKLSSPMQMPVKGEIGMDYAADTLTYSKTLGQYMTHHGIDILGKEGTPVVAALDGEVVEVVVDTGLGIIIGLAHEGNLITRYANLSTTEMVKVGDRIKKGQTISGIGNSGLFEKAEGPHLHFEVLLDGIHVDPKKYLPIK